MLIVKIMGGLANQLFQYSFMKKLMDDFPDEEVVADVNDARKATDHGKYKLDKFVELKYVDIEETQGAVVVQEDTYDKFLAEYKKDNNYYFLGYWQEEKYYEDSIKYVIELFDKFELDDKNRAFCEKITSTESVSLHVRRGDYTGNYMHGNIATKAYYQNAIDYIEKEKVDVTFFVFSDDIEWCKSNLELKKAVYISGNEDKVEYDIFLMSKCKHNIISNSSFSFWGQKLNRNKDKLLIAPPYWYNEYTLSQPLIANDDSRVIRIRNTRRIDKKCETPFFSILIPAYNVETCVKRCLSSVMNQSYENFEIVVVDDASTDNTKFVVDNFTEEDCRVKVISHDVNKGLLSARLTAMREAMGKYIILLDSDDYLEEGALQNLYNKLSEKEPDILEFSYVTEPVKDTVHCSTSDKGRVEGLLKHEYPETVWNKCYSINLVKKLLERATDFRCTFSEDSYFSLLFYQLSEKVDTYDILVTHYVRGSGYSTSENMTEARLANNIESITNMKKHISEFISYDSRFTANAVDEYVLWIVRYLYSMCYNSTSEAFEKYKFFNMIDEAFGTNYINDSFEKIRFYDEFVQPTYTKQIKKSVKYMLHRTKKMIKGKINK